MGPDSRRFLPTPGSRKIPEHLVIERPNHEAQTVGRPSPAQAQLELAALGKKAPEKWKQGCWGGGWGWIVAWEGLCRGLGGTPAHLCAPRAWYFQQLCDPSVSVPQFLHLLLGGNTPFKMGVTQKRAAQYMVNGTLLGYPSVTKGGGDSQLIERSLALLQSTDSTFCPLLGLPPLDELCLQGRGIEMFQ